MDEKEMVRRLRSLESRVPNIEASTALDARTVQRELQEAEVFVRKLHKKAGGDAADTGLSTVSSACTSACFSSASTLCAQGSPSAAAKDPELAQVFATLHRRGVEVLGEEAFMGEVLKRAEARDPVNVFDIAEGR